MDKANIRNLQRARLRDKNHEIEWSVLKSVLSNSLWWQGLLERPLLLGVYRPLADEVDWEKVLPWSKLWKALYPAWGPGGERVFVEATGQWERVHGFFVPKGGKAQEPQGLIVPGLAFDLKTGARLGRGAGWYDRYLSDFEGWTLGIVPSAWEFSPLPEDSWDRRMDGLLTLEGLRKRP